MPCLAQLAFHSSESSGRKTMVKINKWLRLPLQQSIFAFDRLLDFYVDICHFGEAVSGL
jgi:hypothetical protein